MQYLERIVCLINENFKAVFTGKNMGKNRIFGLTQPVQRGKTDVIPACLVGGEWKYVGVDDTDNLRMYHKLYTDSYELVQGSSYGRSGGDEKCISTLGLVVFGMRDRVKLSQYDLKQLVNRNLIERISKAETSALKLKSVIIGAVSANMDMASVFSQEYKNVPYALNEKHILFELKYQIEVTYQKECSPTC